MNDLLDNLFRRLYILLFYSEMHIYYKIFLIENINKKVLWRQSRVSPALFPLKMMQPAATDNEDISSVISQMPFAPVSMFLNGKYRIALIIFILSTRSCPTAPPEQYCSRARSNLEHERPPPTL